MLIWRGWSGFDALPLWHEDEYRIFVHAGVPDETRALERQDPNS